MHLNDRFAPQAADQKRPFGRDQREDGFDVMVFGSLWSNAEGGKREIDRLIDAIAKGHGNPAVLGPRSSVLDEERKQLAGELNAEPAVDDVISLHPAVLARYEQQLVHLQDALSKGVSAGDSEAAEAIRDLVETVTVFRNPSHPGGVTVEIVGRLNALLGEQAYPHNVRGVW